MKNMKLEQANDMVLEMKTKKKKKKTKQNIINKYKLS